MMSNAAREASPLEMEIYERGQEALARLPYLASDCRDVFGRIMESGVLTNDDAAELSMLSDCIADLPTRYRRV